MTNTYYVAARAVGSHGTFVRVGRAKHGGRFLWWNTRYARALLHLRLLAGSVDDAGLLAFKAWCREQRLEPKIDHVTSLRERGRDLMDWGLANEPRIHYAQLRPMNLRRWRDRLLDIHDDCSGSYHGLSFSIGGPDPSGRGFDGTGNTESIRGHLPERQAASQCRLLDPIVYGPPGDASRQHVAPVYEPGPDPLVWSLGQESGPRLYRHSVELAAHGGHCTYHDLGID